MSVPGCAPQMNGGSTTGTGVPPGSGPTGPEHAAAYLAAQQEAMGVAVPVPVMPLASPMVHHPANAGPHAQLNGGSKTGIGVKRVPPPIRTVSLPGGGNIKNKGAALKPSAKAESHDPGNDVSGSDCNCSMLILDVFKNLGVCVLVLLYLLFGAFVFLAMNENLWDPSIISGASDTGNVTHGEQHLSRLQLAIQDSRARTIERIWNITVNLNILYRDNWTELAGREIERFQNQLVERLAEDIDTVQQVRHVREATEDALALHRPRVRVFHHHSVRWNFAQAFLFSLTVITTIGYGSFTPLTPVGKAATMAYAAVGIPLMLLYLSAVGGLLARCARGVFTRAVCCCLCSKCGYCCYDESRMLDKERRMRKRRQELELKLNTMRVPNERSLHAPYYVRESDPPAYPGPRISVSGHSSGSGHHISVIGSVFSGPVMAPVLLCATIMICYVMGGAVCLWGMRAFYFLDCVFFCFMSLTTIGFGNLVPGAALIDRGGRTFQQDADTILWFCSAYILIGMALTTMCCNVVYSVLLHAIRHAGAGSSKH